MRHQEMWSGAKFRQLGSHYAEAFVLAFGVVTFVTTMEPLAEKVQELSASALVNDGKGLVLNKTWAATIVGLGLLLLVNAIVGSILFVKKNRLEKQEEETTEIPRLKLARKSLHAMISAAERIVNHLYPSQGGVPYSVDHVSLTRTIRANGDAFVRARYVIRACDKPLPCWRINIKAEAESSQIEYLDEIAFRAEDPKTHNPITYLVTTDDPLYKQISVFLLPHLNPGKEAREVLYQYMWPKMSKKLLVKGHEQFKLDLMSREPIGKIDFCLLFDPDLQNLGLSCNIVSANLQGATLSPMDSDAGLKGWQYSASNVPPTFSCQLEVKAREKGGRGTIDV